MTVGEAVKVTLNSYCVRRSTTHEVNMPLSVNIQELFYMERESSTTIATIAFLGLEIKIDVIKCHKA